MTRLWGRSGCDCGDMVGEAEAVPLDAPGVAQGEPEGGGDRSHDHDPDGPTVEAAGPYREDEPATLPSWPDPPEDAAFHGLAGRVARLIEPYTEADVAGLLLQLLVGFGNALVKGQLASCPGAVGCEQ